MNSNRRIVELVVPLLNGQSISQIEMTKKYNISVRTFQRDIADIRHVLTEHGVGDVRENVGVYKLVRDDDINSLEKALITTTILLGSRAFESKELTDTLDYVASKLSPEFKKILYQQTAIPRGSYTPLSKPKPLLHRLKEVEDCILNNQKITFTYLSSQPDEKRPRIHHAQPVAVFFEMHYFYIAMMSEERNGYWMYRLDRIVEILSKENGQKLDYATKFSLQDHQHQTYLLDSGSLKKIQFIYRGYIQTVLDHFPNAHIAKDNKDGSYLIEAYLKVDGAMLWLVGQGDRLEVVSPPSVVREVKTALLNALSQYERK